MLRICFFSLFILMTVSLSQAAVNAQAPAPWTRLIGVGGACHDGDTCDILIKGKVVKVRFYGIDAPELEQKFGTQARAFTDALVRGKKLSLECRGESFERIVCTVFQAGRNINSEVVRYGWAFDFPTFSQGRYQSLEDNAHKRRLGIWTDERRLVSPFCYRHEGHRACREDRLFMP